MSYKFILIFEATLLPQERSAAWFCKGLLLSIYCYGKLTDGIPMNIAYLFLMMALCSLLHLFYIYITFCRFKLILGQLQLDNQLPLSTMPVVLATESRPDSNRPVFKANVAVSNVTSNGIQVYPHVYIRVMLLLCVFQHASLYSINPYLKQMKSVFYIGN